MNKKIMILFLVLLTGFLFCDSNLMSQIDTDDFYYRNMRWEKPSKSGFEIKVFGIDYDLEYLDKRPNYERTDVLKNYYKENEKLTKNALLVLLKSDKEFILSSPGKDLHRYLKLYNNRTPMGETFFRVYSTGSGLGFDYKLIFLDGDKVSDYTITCIFGNNGEEYMSSRPDLFVKNDGFWYWKNDEAKKIFFEMLLNHDKRLPKEFIEIQVLYEKILENLEVNGQKITVK